MAPTRTEPTNRRPPLAFDASAWQAHLVQRCLVGSSVVLLCGALAAYLLHQTDFSNRLIMGLAGLGVLCGLLASLNPKPTRPVVGFLLVTFCTSVAGIVLQAGWIPVFVGGSFFVLVLSGLVAGRWAVVGLGVGIVVGLLVEGYAIGRGWWSVRAVELEPDIPLHWARAGLLVLLTTGAASVTLRHALTALRRAHVETTDALLEVQREADLAEAARAERVEKEHALLKTQKLHTVRQLFGGLGHHFNNLLTVACGVLNTLGHTPTVAEVRSAGRKLVEGMGRGQTVLKDLMLFSRHKERRPQRIDIASALTGFGSAIKNTTRDDTLVAVELHDPGSVEMDPDVLHQLLFSVVLNAFDALTDGGRVLITARRMQLDQTPSYALRALAAGSYVVIKIRDDGAGMDAETLAQAALPFFTTKDLKRHVGLGLSTVFGAVRGVGGTLAIESEPDRGTTVSIYLPAISPTSPPFESLPSTEPGPLGHAASPQRSVSEPALSHIARVVSLNATIAISDSGVITVPPIAADASTTTPKGVDPMAFARWEERAVLRLLQVGAGFLVLGIGVALATDFGYVLPVYLLALALFLWGSSNRHTHQRRVTIMLTAMWIIAGPLLVHQTYLAAATLGLGCLTLAISAAFGTMRTLIVNLATLVVVFALGAWLHATGAVSFDLRLFDRDVPGNWYRIAASLALEYAFLGLSVFLVYERARQTAYDLLDARRTLEAAQEARGEELERLFAIQKMVVAANRMQLTGRMSEAIAHDLGNAMQVLVGCAWELHDFAPEAAPEGNAVEVAGSVFHAVHNDLVACVEYATGLVAQFDFGSQMEAHAPERAVDVSAVVQRAVQSAERGLQHLQVISRIAPGLHALVHARDVQRVFMNLFQNGKHSMQAGGTLTVTVRDALLHHVELVVEDTGCGMDAETQQRALEPFFTTKGLGEGTGLGMNIIQEVVQRSQGEVSLVSEPGRGTTVAVRWPKQSPPPASMPVHYVHLDGVKTGTVLLAEDHDLIRPMFCAALRDVGFQVVEASDGDEAIARLAEHDIDVLCIDAVMPGQTTKDIIAAYRAEDPRKPVVLCSGHLPEELSTWGLLQADIVFVAKPVDPSAYARIVVELV